MIGKPKSRTEKETWLEESLFDWVVITKQPYQIKIEKLRVEDVLQKSLRE